MGRAGVQTWWGEAPESPTHALGAPDVRDTCGVLGRCACRAVRRGGTLGRGSAR
jgi:hypothetical protein